MRVRFLLTFFVCLMVNPVYLANAIESSYVFEHPIYYSPLANHVGVDGDIVAITEDKQGFIWFVSDNGLWRWDSHMAVRATFATENTSTVPPQVYTVETGFDGRLWVGTSQGLFWLEAGSRQLFPVPLKNSQALSIQNLTATQQSSESVFVATDRALFKYSAKFASFMPIPLPYDARIHALHSVNDTLWVGTGKGLLEMRISHGTTELRDASGFPSKTRVSTITTTPEGTLLVGTANRGLYIQSSGQQFRHISLNADSEPWIYSITHVTESNVLLGTFGKGLIELDLNTQISRHSHFDPLHPAGLAHDNVWALLTDSRGLVWMGVNTALQLYDVGDHGVKRILGGTTSETGLKQRQVNTVQAVNQKLVVGSGGSGLEQLDLVTGKSETIWDDGSDPIETLVFSDKQQVFASSNFSSVMINPATGESSPLRIPGRQAAKYSSAFARADDKYWVGGTDGLWTYSQGAPVAQNLLSNAAHERRIASLLYAGNKLWIGTWRGLYVLNDPLSSDIVINQVPDAPALLQDQFIATLFMDSKHQLWAGTSNAGLFVYQNNQQWRKVAVDADQIGGRVEAIAGERNGYVFASTSNSIIAVNIMSLEVTDLVDEATAINRPFRRGAATMTDAGIMVFGGTNGLTLVSPDEVSMIKPLKSLKLTDLQITTADDLTLLPSTIQNELLLPALVKRMSFEFTVLDYMASKSLTYRYRLLGLDESWSITDSEHRVATYTQPEPGTYTFQVQYSSNGQDWQTSGIERRITIPPTWYQTLLAKGIFTLTLCLFAFGLHKLLVKQLRQRQVELEERVASRTAELLEANKTLNQQAEALREASLTDALTGLHNRRFLAQNIERDIAKLHRYYADCSKGNIEPDDSFDMLFFLIDIDHFKAINDKYGHQMGDQVLVETRHRLKRVFREIDYLIRWGGEEFLVVVHNTARQDARILADRVIDAIGGIAYELKANESQHITCSVGYTAYPLKKDNHLALSWEDSIGIADAALYAAKNNNRNTWVGVTEAYNELSVEVFEQIKHDHSIALDYATIEKRD